MQEMRVPSPGGGNGNPLQNPWLENPMDRGAWQATVHGTAECQTQLSNRRGIHTQREPKEEYQLQAWLWEIERRQAQC